MCNIKRFIALIFVFAIISASALSINIFAETSEYSKALNSGTRDEICVSFEGTSASDYYVGEYSIDTLLALNGNELLSELRSLMTETHTTVTEYSDCRDYADETACENGDGKVLTLYTSYSASYSDYQNGTGWNREHVWPKSLGGFDKDGAGADLHHIRPTENRTNSQRGNKKYGNVKTGTNSTGNISGLVGGVYDSTYFEPEDNVKGDVARICLYVLVRWGGVYQKSNNILNVFESVDVLLDWCRLDPVDTWEMGRNEVVEAIQGNRNVFIDYPELAWLIFDKEIPSDMTTPSGIASTPPPCTHESFVEGEIVTEPTENTVGYRKEVCTACEYYKLVEIPMLEKTVDNDTTTIGADTKTPTDEKDYTVYYVAAAVGIIVISAASVVLIIRFKKKK